MTIEFLERLLENGIAFALLAVVLWWVGTKQEKRLSQMAKQINHTNLVLLSLQRLHLLHEFQPDNDDEKWQHVDAILIEIEKAVRNSIDG